MCGQSGAVGLFAFWWGGVMRREVKDRTQRKAGRAGLAMAIVAGLTAFVATPTSFAAVTSAGKPGLDTGASGLPVPRFVSLKAGRVNVRVGPGEDYKIAWVFTKPGLPIEVIQEYDTWRRIRDSDGTMGWVFQSLLSGKRTAVVAPWAAGDPRPIRVLGVVRMRRSSPISNPA